ncbi:MAG TPA: lipid-A-disaccharide synthase [Rhodanobacteraceae bacterium]|nr:lipid-A-disaccharide synthase [Rhodanobacteraceae bacterium]
MVAGEASGDQLGAHLISALKQRFPTARFVGVGGSRMLAEGFEPWHDIEALSVMGFAEVIRHLPRLLTLRKQLKQRLLALKPDVFIGIDAPDFNLGLEHKLKQAGIPVAHYVSPSIWAWRENRAEKIGRSADRVLCLFPMEPPIYAQHGIDARFVGHPLAQRFPMVSGRHAAREALGLPQDQPILAVLPGSRPSEIERLGRIFLDAAQKVAGEIPGLRVVVPAANARCRGLLERMVSGPGTRDPGPADSGDFASHAPPDSNNVEESQHPTISQVSGPGSRVPGPVLLNGHSHQAMQAADVILLASGTATLEAMLVKRPMVVGYRVAPTSYRIARMLRMLKTDIYALPNILARADNPQAPLPAPELMQDDCTADKLADAVLALFDDPQRRGDIVATFERLHRKLLGDAKPDHPAGPAADAVADLIQSD